MWKKLINKFLIFAPIVTLVAGIVEEIIHFSGYVNHVLEGNKETFRTITSDFNFVLQSVFLLAYIFIILYLLIIRLFLREDIKVSVFMFFKSFGLFVLAFIIPIFIGPILTIMFSLILPILT